MRSVFFPRKRVVALSVACCALAGIAMAEPQHGIAMYGDPALPPDFEHLPYANPDAPTGGSMTTAFIGGYDSLNPYIRKGSVPWQLRWIVGDTLMARSLDEPFTLYGLLAETIETGPNREWVEFTLRPEARFSDGSPVTVEDVIWSFETLGTEGHPRYHGLYSKIASMEQTGEHSVRITFNEEDRELALLAGLRPILKKDQWDGVDFAESDGTDMIPIVSSEYVIGDFEAGRFVSLVRDPDYWGNGVIPFRNGVGNLDEVRFEFFGDETAAFEAFKTGIVNSNREFNVARWESQYDFPMVQDGEIVLSVLPHFRPSGMTGFVMNTRKPQFEDWRVREALIQAFNFEFINESMTGSQQPRITSYFSNSPLGMEHGPAEGRVLEFLQEYQDALLPGAIDGYSLPESDGSERNRQGTATALELLAEAGWTVQDGVLANEDGEPFTFEILLTTGASENQSIIDMYTQSLARIGITPSVSAVDSAQYKERTDLYDFDMTYYRVGLSLSPGNEQYLYFGAERADEPGGRNLMGVSSPAVDGMIDKLLTSESQDDFLAAARALDRVLMSGRYVIPIYQWNISRVAHSANLHYPDYIPLFGDWPGWQPDVWWYEE
ncbi:ABC transporter substrate-binding protein [Ponticoccus sp. SC2-23]|uniref:extracellular solute-binding protein n=1 Tax=Alexandriicola marinus TaxID=2081710 RepID=UPI000FDC3A43|nr:extracellular solute-binding protein [Alexandriicola marinus]MBM1218874.1 ABC transporter substrate-binding protein [Ponticoccus sp. SC6-9]MBM1224054.1 ABC transporter substrate-binding protein [Ponticoccus sp. SC6-15]MBM1230167.1 ABC transporter substrate-binding protein [Ponticoccus sp. SC6-38]MBM1233020.1 ABC transporter substrate-binding protein [Ponticoccus sp. SC6-45]MBM1237030.1 ABC transporter substrate-binding protein [Ponticoccus sp. SC6-49]MBM1242031.1 ABC transporter substrate-